MGVEGVSVDHRPARNRDRRTLRHPMVVEGVAVVHGVGMMGRPRKLLNVRAQLEGIIKLNELFKEYGGCPLFIEELSRAAFLARMTLRKHTTRKDLYVETAPDATP